MSTLLRLGHATLFVITIGGCSSTIHQVQQAQLNVLEMSKTESEKVLADLKNGTIPPDFDVHIWLQMDVVNRALAAVNQTQFALPNAPSITVTIESVRLSTYGALPTAELTAHANKGSLAAEIALTTILVPKEGGVPGELSIKVLSFVPKIQWYFFELTKAEFSRALLTAEVNKLADRLPSIRLPVEQVITIGGSAKSDSIRIKTSDTPSFLTMGVTYPSTLRVRTLKVQRYVFLKSGVHVFGALE